MQLNDSFSPAGWNYDRVGDDPQAHYEATQAAKAAEAARRIAEESAAAAMDLSQVVEVEFGNTPLSKPRREMGAWEDLI